MYAACIREPCAHVHLLPGLQFNQQAVLLDLICSSMSIQAILTTMLTQQCADPVCCRLPAQAASLILITDALLHRQAHWSCLCLSPCTGSFTQVVWAATTEIGCGLGSCSYVTEPVSGHIFLGTTMFR